MVKTCVCAGCTNSSLAGHKVHAFPKKGSKAFRSWVRFVQVKRARFTASSVQDKHSVICGAHFRDEDYMPGDLMEHRLGFRALASVRLSPNAVPFIQSPGQSQASTGRTRSSAAVHKLGLTLSRTPQSDCATPDVADEPMKEEEEDTVQSSEPSLQVSPHQTDVGGGCQTDRQKSVDRLGTQLIIKTEPQMKIFFGTQFSKNTRVYRSQGSQTSIHWKSPISSTILKPCQSSKVIRLRLLDDGDVGDSIDFIPAHSVLTESTLSQASPSINDVPKYIVDEDCLLQLFEECPLCCSMCKVQTTTRGTFLTVYQLCPQCHFNRNWRSRQTEKAVPSDYPRSCTNGPESSAAAAITEIIDFSDENDSSNEGSSEVDSSNEGSGEVDEEEHNSDSDWDPLEHHNIDDELPDEGQNGEVDGGDHNSDSDWDPPDSNSESDTIEKHENLRQLCPECGTFFHSQNQKAHTCEYKKPYSCVVCGKRYLYEFRLKSHNKIHEDGYEHVCNYCFSTFRTRHDKITHEQRHQTAEKPYQCPDCPEVFAKMRERRDHLLSHRGPTICVVCNMEFSDNHKMQTHVVVHTKAKQFICEVCQRSFTQSSQLKSHMRVHTGEKPHQCQHCDKSFNRNVRLKSHIQRYHGQVPDPGMKVQMEKTSRNESEAEKDETNEMESSAVDAEEAEQNNSANRAMRRERVFRDRENMFEESDEWLQCQFRLPRHSLVELCIALEPQLTRQTNRSHPIPAHIQVLCSLGFLATGTFQRAVADKSNISQASISRTLPKVLDGIIRLAPQYIQFPHTAEQQQEIKQNFFHIAGFPNTIGAIDCTHVRIIAPSPQPSPYLNRKGYHSINVQIICDADMNIINAVSRWGGDSHDSFILQNSSVGMRLAQEAAGDAWLIGDKGYALSTWLMTPLNTPRTQQERAYNDSLVRTHAIVERTIGVLKGRWLCLDLAGGKLLYKPDKVCKITMACCVLHNIANRHGVPLPDAMPPPIDMPLDPPIEAEDNKPALALRQGLIDRFGSKCNV